MAAATKDDETKVDETEGSEQTEAKTPKKEKRPFVLTPFQVRNRLNKRLQAEGLKGDVQGPMMYSYANAGHLGTIGTSADGRQVVEDEAKADAFIESFVANRKAGGTGVRAPKSEKDEAEDATPSESDELAEDADESNEDESGTDDLVEAE